MVEDKAEKLAWITSSAEQIEDGSDWRTYMRAPATLVTDKFVFDLARIEEFPQATLASAFLLAKIGDPIGARERLNILEVATDKNASSAELLAPDILLVDAHVRVYEDRALTEEDSTRLTQLLSTLPANDLVGQALTFNHLSTAALHRGEFDRAQDHAENAIRLYRLGDAQFGSLHMHTHLGQIRMMRGDLSGAIAQYDDMEASLDQLTGDPQGLRAICQALKSEVYYEMNEMGVAQALAGRRLRQI